MDEIISPPDPANLALACAITVISYVIGFAALEKTLSSVPTASFPRLLLRNAGLVGAIVLAYTAAGFDMMYSGEGFRPWWRAILGITEHPSLYFADYASGTALILSDVVSQTNLALSAGLLPGIMLAQRISVPMAMIGTAVFTLITYSIFGYCKWGGGFLSDWGFYDFAGGTVAYGLAGAAAMGISFAFRCRERVEAAPEVSWTRRLPWAAIALGVFLVLPWIEFWTKVQGWMADALVRYVWICCLLASAASLLAAIVASLFWRPRALLSGSLLGLISGTAVVSAGADTIPLVHVLGWGALAGAASVCLHRWLHRTGLPDPVGAISAFGFAGMLGTVAAGFYNLHEVRIQLAGVALALIWGALPWFALAAVLRNRARFRT